MNGMTDIEERAIEWRVRREQSNWDEWDEAELETWLDQATAHRVAWLRAEYGWRQVGRLATSPSLGEYATVPPVYRRRRVWGAPAAAAAAMVMVVAAGIFAATQSYKWMPGYHETTVGAREVVALADGSRVELNTDTELRATVDETQRAVWLHKGEAFFDIAHDPSRQFVVHAGDRRVVVLGTRFSVWRDGDRVRVAVADGRVRVEREKPKKPAPPVVAEPGEIVIAKADSEIVTPPSPEKVERELAWRQGYLMFDKSSLAEAVTQFNRYNTTKLVIDEPVAGNTRISGRFDATNVAAFVRLLQRAYGLRVVEQDERIRISG